MLIQKPLANDVTIFADLAGVARLDVQGIGFDPEDKDPISGQTPFTLYWYDDRGDIAGQTSQWLVPPGVQVLTLRLRHDPADGLCPTVHTIRLYGLDSKGNEGASPVLRVGVMPYGALPSSTCG